jgi:alpha-ribazole phosphatase
MLWLIKDGCYLSMTRFLLVRHGETELQSSLRYWGRTDVPLAKSGIQQAECLRDRLAEEKILSVYSSSLKRAELTAQIIASAHGLQVEVCPELREVDFGQLEGLNYKEIEERFPEIARLWASRSEDLIYPAGESLSELEKRVGQFKARMNKESPPGTVLIVAHAGVLRSLICQMLELRPQHRWNIRVDLASLSVVESFPEVSILNLLNDTGHLEKLGRNR